MRNSLDENLQAADAIRREMDTIRANLGSDVDGLMSNAQQLTDWRHYVRQFPWPSLGAVLALGYFAVPRKLEIVSPDEKTLRKLAKHNRLVVEHQPRGEEKRGLLMSLANLTGNMLLRAGIAYVGQQAGKVFGEQAAEPVPQEADMS